ncbi:hydroxyacylglutathione hydrolase [Endobacter medicaginis]|uniref:Hydroxyacylglutathione hydrolase n=1 Tax=Endobacter medicaginis TaxID=1181271 RepID=A0A839UUW2_9PROT|nr:FAD/NAD(P)-binding protein [Endobacter medicaginis]MBB3172204.1 hydroxyacylglutathione hydrolase [Endobacter medicaginis]MCX5476564.1 FAD/NAD(P)-binding protein [Endobacter medicaginis]
MPGVLKPSSGAPAGPTIAIIGAGASGTLLARALWRRGQGCVLVEAGSVPGPGLAYATRHPEHVLNVRAGAMGADADRPEHFIDWLRARDPSADAADFVPRGLYGRYLRALLDEAAPQVRQARAMGLRRAARGWAVTLDGGGTVLADEVVLALGHLPPAPLPCPADDPTGDPTLGGHLHPDPWRLRLPGGIGAEAEVVLVGAGLTAVDTVLALRAGGHRGRLVALSRHGRLPQAHRTVTPLAAPAVPPGTPPGALALLVALRRAIAGGADWRAAVDSLRPVSNALWQAAPEAERARFQRHLRHRWEVARHRMAPAVADEIDRLRAQGVLDLRRGRVEALRRDAGGDGLVIEARGPEGAFALRADHAICCTGTSLRYGQGGCALASALFAQGLARPGRDGIGFALTAEGRIEDAQGAPVAGLWAIGPARLGALFESSAIPEIRQQAAALAARLTGAAG